MNDPLTIAETAIPQLHSLLSDLIDLSEKIGRTGIRINNPASDPSAIPAAMAFAYVSKQNEHLRSVRVLISAGQHRDALLIARSMIEGIAQLHWAFDNLPDGPEKWFRFGYIEDWRELEKHRQMGLPIDPEIENIAQAQMLRYGADYEEPRKRAKPGGPPHPDPYRIQWSDLSAWGIFNKINAQNLYDILYRDASAWVHWSPRSMYLALNELGDRMLYQIRDPQRAAAALAAGSMSLLMTLRLINRYLHLEREDDIAELDRRLAQITSPLNWQMQG